MIEWHAVGVDDVPPDDDWLDAFELRRFARMTHAKRLSESRMSRWTAKTTAAAALGLPTDRAGLARIAVRNAPDGAPELFVDGEPARAVIAMTDRSDWAVTAVRSGTERIGCDLEVVERRSPAFVADYFTPVEQELVAAGDHDVMANLIWSAKESALKVLRTGLRRDTRTVDVAIEPVGADVRGSWLPFTVSVDDGAPQWGWWIRYGDFLLTVAAAIEVPLPESLTEPPTLASAKPTHRWMRSLIPTGDPPTRPGPDA